MSERLKQRLIDLIGARGAPMPFDEYMECALYDDDDGFFTTPPVGRAAHFVTSPHVSPAFGMLLAEHVRETYRALGEPGDFLVCELGAGDGTLAAQMRDAGIPGAYIAVERSSGARAALHARGFAACAALEEVEPFTGCVLANELLDNLPFAIARATDDGVVELFVGVRDGELVFVEAPPRGDEVLAHSSSPPVVGEDRAVSVRMGGYLRALGGRLRRGSALFIDYGFMPGEPVEPIRGYRGHRVESDLLADPGGSDITGPVDFGALIAAARAAGFETHGPVTQREALLALGFHQVRDALRARQQQQQQAGDHRGALMTFSARNEAAMLLESGGLGGLRVLALTTNETPPPRATASG
ncbi:MAG TPA: SAM-dependent methyltransferase [Actinomycetota bacterium]|nr:SAM-dependent methyltransferase [Actinomycetota bacterium]